MTFRTSDRGLFNVAVLTCSALFASGCGNGGFGSELKVRPKPRPLSQADDHTIRLPEDQPFSITLAPSHRSPGLSGTATAEADVSGDGNAHAVAKVDNGGEAQAGFQLGHAFENDSNQQMQMDVRVRCAFETTADAQPPSQLPDARVDLKLYARDDQNRLLRNFNLVQHSTDEGAASSTDQKDIAFVLTLGPRRSINVFLAGNVQIDVPDGHSATGSIKLSGLELEVSIRMAPPVRTAGDEQA